MSSASFRRHTKLCVDTAIHRVVASLHRRHAVRDAFLRLVCVAHARSNLMRTPPTATGGFVQLDALCNLMEYQHAFVRDPYAWTGATGHPWRVVHALASHLLAPYAMPRFLASVWFGTGTAARREQRDWFVAHGHGQSFRRLALPIAMTRGMEHVFLRSPDHLTVEHALRRAEVIGVGGSPALARAILATPLATTFDHGALWREVIEWFVRCGDTLELRHVGPIIGYVEHVRAPGFTLTGRTLDAVLHDVEIWAARPRGAPRVAWSPSRWRGFVHDVDFAEERVRWSVVELVDSDQLTQEGRAMRHCVGSYARRCAYGGSTIWSLRRRGDDQRESSVLTVEVNPHTATIVQVRGLANRRATGWPLEVLRMWAAREGLAMSG